MSNTIHISQISGNRDTIPNLKAKIIKKYDFDSQTNCLRLELQGFQHFQI